MLIRGSAGSGAAPRFLACLVLLAAGCWLWPAGCGYRPYGAGATPDIQRLHLAALTNKTFRPGLEGLVGAAILKRFQQDGRVQLVPSDTADAVLAGIVSSYQNIPITFTQTDIGRRFRVRVSLSVRLTERGGEKVLLSEEIFGEAYYTSGAVGVTAPRAAEQEAAQRAAQDLAGRVVTRIADGL
jgi:hypothetical protein